MADQKISQLTAATTPLAGTEVFPIVQSGSTVKATIANVQAAPIAAQTANTMLFLNGSKVPSTSANATFDGTNLGLGASPTFFGGRFAVGGHIAISAGNSLKLWNAGGSALNTVDSTGVNFTANTPAAGMTSQLLNTYEEGTWTPSVGGNATYVGSGQVGRYTRIGRLVIAEYTIGINVLGSGSLTDISGLPYPINATVQAIGSVNYFSALAVNVLSITAYGFNSSSFRFYGNTTAAATSAGPLNVFGNGAYIQGNLIYTV